MELLEEGPITKEAQDKYRVFKKNTPFLYDYVSTHALLWPSLTVQFLPDLEAESDTLAHQRLLFGTFTLGQSVDAIQIHQLPYYRNLNGSIDPETWRYVQDKQEFELPAPGKTALRQMQTINHRGDVNRLRYMPQNPDVVASSNNLGELLVYNRTKHSTIKKIGQELDINEPQLRLRKGSVSSDSNQSETDIFAFDWCRQSEGRIVLASMDGQINAYDIKKAYPLRKGNVLALFWNMQAEVGINDIEWVPTHDALFVAADDRGALSLYDLRTKAPQKRAKSHFALNSVSMNPNTEFALATGDSEGNLAVWDLRDLLQSATERRPHTGSVTQVKWHPKYSSVLGSCSTDQLVKIHDFSHEEPLLFSHDGHMLGVNDFDWSLHEDFMVASVADDNSLHVWKPAKSVIYRS